MPPSSNDIQAEPPEPRRAYEPEIAPCPHCGEPVASLCLICPHCETPIERDRPPEDESSEYQAHRGGRLSLMAFLGFLSHVLIGLILVLHTTTSGSFLDLLPYVVCSGVI